MRYRELFKLGWALTWRELAWCTVVGLPAVMVMGLLFDALGLQKATNPGVFIAAFAFTMIVAVLFLAMPRVLRAVIAAPYDGFHVAVRRSTTARASNTLSYCEALQLGSSVVLAMLVVEVIVDLALPDRLAGALGGVALGFLVTNPAVAAIMLKMPYRGFRLEIVREA